MAFPRPILLLSGVCGVLLAGPAVAAPPAEAMRLLKSNCFSCHNEQKKKGGLVMTSRDGLLTGGEGGPALVEGKPEKSEIILSLAPGGDPHMPPKKQLTPAQIATLSQWVKEGAQWDAAALEATPPSPPRAVTLAEPPASYHPVLALALSPDGQKLAVGCGNHLLVYQVGAAALTLAGRSSAHPDPIQSVAWSPDGALLATGAFRRVVIWKAGAELAREREITGALTDRITALRFLPDQRLVIADGRIAEEGTLRLADPATGAIAQSWPAHADTIFGLAVSADGKLLATAGGDKLVKIWDLATQKETARLEGHVAQVLSVAFDKDGAQLVSGGADQQLKVWDVKTRERILTLGTHTSAVNAVAWATAAPAVLAATAGGAVLSYTELKAHTGATSRERGAKERNLDATDDVLYCLSTTPDGTVTVGGSQDGRVFLWDKSGKLVATVKAHESPVTASLPK